MLTITEAANSRVKEMMAEEEGEGLFLRVAVKGGGCTGLSYGMGFDSELNDSDTQFEDNGVRVVIDKESEPLLRDVTIDFKQNMMGGGFTIDNPNAIATCGCGQSFKTATNAGTPDPNC
ncbi:HesB/IscA family protein [Tuberibacillus sp. Marseille-P3662]|uniref:HesB/IscA family protein n=1 Tax=Tuberibacillus sp. Marseille-P3662 TaxID=1965358 RepID=UPI000A1CA474|nr:iron-sulfur cluster assembly accessory protein [Tuberibacillus sp. Marseille-P3662]